MSASRGVAPNGSAPNGSVSNGIHADSHLAGLVPGERAVVRRVHGAPDFSRRMSELGLVPGTEIRLVRRAPFGDPIEFVVRGTHFSIRRTEAEGIRVGIL